MFLKLVKTSQIEVNGQSYALRYYEQRTGRGMRRYSCEVLLGGSDRIIIDDDTMMSLESRVERLAPATVYSRVLAAAS
jgi:hemin uptake protein HemP